MTRQQTSPDRKKRRLDQAPATAADQRRHDRMDRNTPLDATARLDEMQRRQREDAAYAKLAAVVDDVIRRKSREIVGHDQA